MSIVNYPNGLASFGVTLAGQLPVTGGNIYFVNYGTGSDGNSGLEINRPFKTISKAYSVVTDNNYDVIALCGNAEHVLTSMLTVSKNRVIFIGLDGSSGRRYGQRSIVSIGITTATTDIGAILVTGVGCVFKNIKFISTNTLTQALYTFVDGGGYTQVENCEIYKETHLSVTGAAELVANGDSSHYLNCYIGSTANLLVGAILRPCVTFTRGLAGTGLCAKDVTFEGVVFARKCSDVANTFVYGLDANAIERMGLFKNCVFWNNILATATPDQCVKFAVSQTAGSVLLWDCTSIKATKLSTTTGVFLDSPVPTATTSGVSVQGA